MPPRVLVVDDDAAIRAALVEALDDGTMDIAHAGSAEEAIGLLETDRVPDLVLSDIRMRGIDGLDLLRIVRDRAPGSKVVMMTAYHDVGTAVTAMREGAADFLCKPFDLPTLRGVVDRMLGTDTSRSTLAIPEADGSPNPFRNLRLTPSLLGSRYELGTEVGRGAMATVYRARDTRHGRDVAVKLLRPEVAASIGCERFLREIQLTARLHHPHILTLIDSGDWKGAPFFVMPLVNGASLRMRLKSGPSLDIPFIASILRGVADALSAAHALGIVHRDIKPGNVLLSGTHAWVADFGVARALGDAAGPTDTMLGSAIGTPAYMAPEQVRGIQAIDHRADLYALGILAYELLVGRPPFTDRSAAAILAAQMFTDPEPLGKLRPDVPRALEEIVTQCLAKGPDDRPSGAEELVRRLGTLAVDGDR